jgi:hypothetical protein
LGLIVLQSGRYPQDWVEFHNGKADPICAETDLVDATEVSSRRQRS